MVKVKTLQRFTDNRIVIEKDVEIEVSEEKAKRWVDAGAAERIKESNKK